MQKRDVFADVTSGSKAAIERPGMAKLLEYGASVNRRSRISIDVAGGRIWVGGHTTWAGGHTEVVTSGTTSLM